MAMVLEIRNRDRVIPTPQALAGARLRQEPPADAFQPQPLKTTRRGRYPFRCQHKDPPSKE
jgi:hypothetical protein